MPGNQPSSHEQQTVRLDRDASTRSLNPDKVGEYTVLRPLGEGGMGMVYLAHDPELRRDVAIKMVRSELLADDSFISRFFREARLSASLNHPNIVTTYRAGRHDDTPYIVLEFVRGLTLRDRFRQPPPLAVSRILEIMIQCCDGLEAAARHGIVHRDIKPANIMIRDDGLVKIMDFGLSKQIDGEKLTVSTAVMGTPDYMPPEQAAGKPVDFRADIYSLGITLFQCIAGYLPYKSTSVFETIRQHAENPLPEDSRLKSIDGARLFRLVQWMTAKAADDRPASYQVVKSELAAILKNLEQTGEADVPVGTLDPDALADAFLPKEATPGQRAPTWPVYTNQRQETPVTSGGRRRAMSLVLGILALCSVVVVAAAGGVWLYMEGFSLQRRPSAAPPPAQQTSTTNQTDTGATNGGNGLTASSPIRADSGPVNFSTSRAGTATARDILHGLGNLGQNQVLSPNLHPEHIPVAASFSNRTAGHVIECLALAAGWEAREEHGIRYVMPGDSIDPVRVERHRQRVDLQSYPLVSLNTINQPTTVRMMCDKLFHDYRIDYLVVGHEVQGARLPSVSLSGASLPALMELIHRQSIPIQWTVVDQTLIIVPAARP